MVQRAHFVDDIQANLGGYVVVSQGGWSVQLYEPGTTTPLAQTIYSAASGVAALPNPLSISGTVIDFYLNRPQFVTLSINKSGFPTLTRLVFVGKPFTNVTDVTEWGAIGDGLNNDTAAIVAASVAAGVGGVVYFPQPSVAYMLDPITLTLANQVWMGDPQNKTMVKLRGQNGGPNVPMVTISTNFLTLDGLVLDGNSSGIGSGVISGPGLIQVIGGSNDTTIRRCVIQNTGATGIYAYGYQGTQTYRLRVEDNQFTNIGRAGAGNGGCCVMLDGGINDAKIMRNRAYGVLTSNFLKGKVNSAVNCIGTLVEDNTLDYTACTTFDATNAALGIELWNGMYNSRVVHNFVYGPNTIPVAGSFWGISLGDARYSTVEANVVWGGTNIQAMVYGIEIGECPLVTVTNNVIANCIYGSNATNNNPTPCHGQVISNNIYFNCYTNGITTDSGPRGIKIIGNTFVDCGTAYIFLNSTNAISRECQIKNNTFLIKDQTRLHPENRIYGVYVIGTARTDVVPVEIVGNEFGYWPGGAGTVGLVPLEVNNPQGVRFMDNMVDGGRPTDGAAQADRAVFGYCYGLTVKRNKAKNLTSEFGFSDANQVNVIEDNDVGALGWTNWTPTAAAGANAGGGPPAPIITTGSSARGGSLTAGTGAAPAAGALVVVTFPARMLAVPFITLAALNTATQALGLYVSSISAAGFTISCTNAPAASQANNTYSVSWHALVA